MYFYYNSNFCIMQIEVIKMIIGICGKSGSGKSTVAKSLIKYYGNETVHLDIDKIGHYVLTIPDVIQKLVNYFGNGLLEDGKINRKKLSVLVFSSPIKMMILTEITWPYMEQEIDKILSSKNSVVILDWLLLPNTKFFSMCNFKVLLDIPYEIRKERVIKRDNITSMEFDLRDDASIEYDKSKFDYIISDNEQFDVERWVKVK